MKPMIPVVITALVVAAGGGLALTRARGPSAAQETQYKLAPVQTGQVKKTVSASGILKPWAVVDIKSKAGGRVDQLSVDVGSVVQKGQVLARIDPTDTLLNVSTAQADIDAARAREFQNNDAYKLQVRQSAIAIQNAQAALQSARASLLAARSRLATAQNQSKAQPSLTRASIQQAEANYRSTLKQRQQLDATDPQERAQAQAAHDQAEANTRNALASLKRQKTLEEKGFVSKQLVDQAQANYDVARATLASAQEKLKTLADQQQAAREAADARVAQAQAQVENARLGSIDIQSRRNAVNEARSAVAQSEAQVAQARAALDQAIANQANNAIKRQDIAAGRATSARAAATYKNAKTTLDQTVVRAPNPGVVLTKYVEEGTIITSGMSMNSTGTSILQIGDTTKMYVDVSVDETDIANVDEGQAVDVSIEAYPGIPFQGKVARVDPRAQVEQNVTTVHVRVEVDNSAPTFRLLKPGMNATCEFVIDKKDDVLSVPTEAVRSDDNGSFVEVATGGKPAPGDPATGTPPDPEAKIAVKRERRTVEVGLEGNETVEVTSGLKEGDQVVTQTIEPAPPATAGSPFGGGRGPGGGGGGGGRR